MIWHELLSFPSHFVQHAEVSESVSNSDPNTGFERLAFKALGEQFFAESLKAAPPFF
jgi:hypothetical protein